MLRSLSFRQRLVLSVALPLGVLAVVSGLAALTARSGDPARAQAVLTTISLLAVGAAVVASLIAMLVVRSTTKPLRQLTEGARRLSDEQLPALVDALKGSGAEDLGYLRAAIRPIEVRSNDELGALVRAFNAVQTVAVDVAAEQADLLRRGIGDIFVSLARRNQVLIDRQIEFLDELEAAAHDQDHLGQLYRLDHLATRMRRNAESLLVLAGVEPNRRRTRPVTLVDVARAAIGETEDYSRIDVVGFEDVEVLGEVAVDLGHLLAELLENATAFSPPDTRVTITGTPTRSGYLVTITDAGVGMSAPQLAEANALIASPPPVGLSLSRSLGFTVVARLAARHSVAVRLAAADPSGVSVSLHVPAHLLTFTDVVDSAGWSDTTSALGADDGDGDEDDGDGDGFNAMTDEEFEEAFQRAWGGAAPDAGLRPAEEEAWRVDEETWGTPSEVEPAIELPATLEEAVPVGTAFEEGLATLIADDVEVPLALVEPPVAVPAAPDVDVDAAAAPARTASGLVRRVPRATLPRPMVGPLGGTDTRPAVARSRRSPEDVRAMLAQYRKGMAEGRAATETEGGPTDG